MNNTLSLSLFTEIFLSNGNTTCIACMLFSRTSPHDYVDMHRVASIPGIYIANCLPQNNAEGQSVTYITFNKGSTWSSLGSPSNPPKCKEKVSIVLKEMRLYLKAVENVWLQKLR